MAVTTPQANLADTRHLALTTATARTGFESLAQETILSIVTQLSDLVSLDSLLRASPACRRLFDEYAVEIFEAILLSEFIHGHIRVMIRIIALIRSGALPIHSLDEFKRRVTHEAMNNRIRPSKDGFVPLDIPRDTLPAVLRTILATDRRIMCLGIDCIKVHFGRFKALQPEHLIDKTFCFKTNLTDHPEVGYIPAWESRPKGKKFPKRGSGPPSWIEEQRVIRALWRVQMSTDLKNAAAHSLLRWSKEDISIVNSMDPGDLYIDYDPQARFGFHPEIEEINTVLRFTEEVPRGRPGNTSDNNTRTQLARPYQELKRDWPTPLPNYTNCSFDEDKPTLKSPTYGYHFYCSAQFTRLKTGRVPQVNNEYSPLRYISFDPFRRLGFAIWSTVRMSGYGLVSRLDHRVEHDFYYFAWLSVLSEDEISEVERRSKADYLAMCPIMKVAHERYVRDLERSSMVEAHSTVAWP